MSIMPKILEGQYHTICFDFDGVLTNNKVYVCANGTEYVQCSRGDGLGFELLKAFIAQHSIPIEILILSRESNTVIQSRAIKLGIKCCHPVRHKYTYLKEYFDHKFPGSKGDFLGLIYIGNDLNDLECIIEAGFSACPSDSHYLVKKYSNIVASKPGGDDFAREVIEALVDLPSLSNEEIFKLLL
jgi:N-acylneuraminate cytidylyltransferase